MTEFIESDDEGVNLKSHKKLLDGIGRINKIQHIKKPTRSEPAISSSEFNLAKTKRNDLISKRNAEVSLNDLVTTLKKTSKHIDIGKRLNQAKRSKKTLVKPLEKPAQERIQRSLGYSKLKKDLDRWDAVVTKNRAADQLEFPLNHEQVEIIDEKPREAFNFKIKSDLMKKLEDLTPQPINKGNDNAEHEFPLTLDELREKRKEMARLRVKESYKIAKAKRMSKIKSKKYHRMMKRDKIRQQMKEFEALQKTDPEAALKQLEVIERTRVEERANLRHKNTGTWAKNLQVRAKYDKDVRKELAQQLAISRELTQKRNIDESSDEEDNNVETNLKEGNQNDPLNPWTTEKNENEIAKFVSGYRKYWQERNENDKKMKEYLDNKEDTESDPITDFDMKNEDIEDDDDVNENFENSILSKSGLWEIVDLDQDEESNSTDDSTEEVSYESLKPKRKSEISLDELFDKAEDKLGSAIDEKLRAIRDAQKSNEKVPQKWKRTSNPKLTEMKSGLEFTNIKKRTEIDEEFNGILEDDTDDIIKLKNLASRETQISATKSSEKTVIDEIDPNNFMSIKSKYLKTDMANTIVEMNDAIDDDDREIRKGLHNNDQQLTIAEAFEEDDIVADFQQEKEEERKKGEISDVDQSLPGWGSWAGAGIKKRPNKHFIIKFPNVAPRRDDNKGSLIINEEVNKSMRNHLVSDLPFPFTSVKDFESSIRAPIGSTFVPETAHKALVQPAVVTKMGMIIKPMDEEMLVKSTKIVEKRSKTNEKRKIKK